MRTSLWSGIERAEAMLNLTCIGGATALTISFSSAMVAGLCTDAQNGTEIVGYGDCSPGALFFIRLLLFPRYGERVSRHGSDAQ